MVTSSTRRRFLAAAPRKILPACGAPQVDFESRITARRHLRRAAASVFTVPASSLAGYSPLHGLATAIGCPASTLSPADGEPGEQTWHGQSDLLRSGGTFSIMCRTVGTCAGNTSTRCSRPRRQPPRRRRGRSGRCAAGRRLAFKRSDRAATPPVSRAAVLAVAADQDRPRCVLPPQPCSPPRSRRDRGSRSAARSRSRPRRRAAVSSGQRAIAPVGDIPRPRAPQTLPAFLGDEPVGSPRGSAGLQSSREESPCADAVDPERSEGAPAVDRRVAGPRPGDDLAIIGRRTRDSPPSRRLVDRGSLPPRAAQPRPITDQPPVEGMKPRYGSSHRPSSHRTRSG